MDEPLKPKALRPQPGVISAAGTRCLAEGKLVPESACSTPANILISVDLPEPFAPQQSMHLADTPDRD